MWKIPLGNKFSPEADIENLLFMPVWFYNMLSFTVYSSHPPVG